MRTFDCASHLGTRRTNSTQQVSAGSYCKRCSIFVNVASATGIFHAGCGESHGFRYGPRDLCRGSCTAVRMHTDPECYLPKETEVHVMAPDSAVPCDVDILLVPHNNLAEVRPSLPPGRGAETKLLCRVWGSTAKLGGLRFRDFFYLRRGGGRDPLLLPHFCQRRRPSELTFFWEPPSPLSATRICCCSLRCSYATSSRQRLTPVFCAAPAPVAAYIHQPLVVAQHQLRRGTDGGGVCCTRACREVHSPALQQVAQVWSLACVYLSALAGLRWFSRCRGVHACTISQPAHRGPRHGSALRVVSVHPRLSTCLPPC